MVDSGCPHFHHAKLHGQGNKMADTELFKMRHPQPCNAGTCPSKLKILRGAFVHYPILRRLLESVYMTRRYHNFVKSVDEAMHVANFNGLCKLVGINENTELIDEDGT